jgi:hypothetical protein
MVYGVVGMLKSADERALISGCNVISNRNYPLLDNVVRHEILQRRVQGAPQ